jgi:hypothetical protein
VAIVDGCRPDPLGRPALGVAVLDGAGTLRALERRPWATPQEAWARQAILQAKRWLANRRVIIVADSSFAALELIAAVRQHVCLVTRLRLDANLFAPARRAGQLGRPRRKGARLPKLAAVLADPKTVWSSITLPEWYGGQPRTLEIMSGMAVWYHSGLPPAPIRWVLARDPAGKLAAQAFLATDLETTPAEILGWFVSRWRVETTFQEVRAHLGVETQRQCWRSHAPPRRCSGCSPW